MVISLPHINQLKTKKKQNAKTNKQTNRTLF
jgi:hypothetical protein